MQIKIKEAKDQTIEEAKEDLAELHTNIDRVLDEKERQVNSKITAFHQSFEDSKRYFANNLLSFKKEQEEVTKNINGQF